MPDRSLGFDVFARAHGSELVKMGELLDRVASKLDSLDRKVAKPKVEPQTKDAEREIGRFADDLQRRIGAAVRSLPDIDLRADSSDVDRDLARVRRELQALADKRIGVDLDATEAQRRARALRDELQRLGNSTADVRVRADTAAAMAELRKVTGEADRVHGRQIHVTARVDGDRALTVLGALAAGLGGVALAAGPAVAALAAVGGAGGAALQGLGTAAVGFSGIGDAVGELSKADSKAASSGASMASARQAQADAIAAASRSMQQAQQQADRSAVQGGWQVADARRAVSDAVTTAARQVDVAEADLAAEQRDARRAQQDLTEARADAVTQLRDLRASVRGAGLDQRAAALDLKEARADLAEGVSEGVTGDDLERLRIAAGRAALGYDEARYRVADLGREQRQWARDGLSASDSLRSAQDRYRGSLGDVQDAGQALVDAQRDGDRQVADAKRELGRTITQTGWAQQDAAASIADAQRQMQQAMRTTAAVGGGAAASLTEDYDKLGPAGKSFAAFLDDRMVPALHRVRDGVQATMLPKVQDALEGLLDIEPLVNRELSATGDVIGDLTLQGSRMVTSGPWRKDFASIMASNRRQLRDYGGAGLDTADAFRSIMVASEPLAERLSGAAERSANLFNRWIQGKRASGELERGFDRFGDQAVELVGDVADVVGGLWDFAKAAAPVTGTILDILAAGGRLISAMPDWALTALASGTMIAVTAGKIGTAVAGLNATSQIARGGLMSLMPTSLYGRMSRVRDGFDAVGRKAGDMTTRMDGSVTAGNRVSKGFSAVGRAATAVGASIPLVGTAIGGVTTLISELNTSAEESLQMIQQGGKTAMNEVARLRTMSYLPDSWGNDLEEFKDGLDDVGRAQVEVADAQLLYGTNSKQYRNAVKRLDDAQRAAAEGTDEHTAAVRNQQDTLLGAIDGEIQFQQAIDDAAAALKTNGRTLDVHTRQGRDNKTALNDIVRAGKGWLQHLRDTKAPATQVAEAQRQTWRQTFEAAKKFGMGAAAARDYANALVGVPENISTNIFANTTPGTIKLGDFVASVKNAKGSVTIGGDTRPGDRKRGAFKLAIDGTTGRVRIEGDKRAGQRVLSDLVNRINDAYGYTKINAKDGLARNEVRELKRWIEDQQFEMTLVANSDNPWVQAYVAGRGKGPGRAEGGRLRGPGTSTSDSIPMWSPAIGPWRGSDDEHVVSAREVRGAGGHGAIEDLRARWRGAPGRAEGGPLRPAARAAASPAERPGRAPAAAGAAEVRLGGMVADPKGAAKGIAGLAGSVRDLTDKALAPLSRQLAKDTEPALKSIEQQAGVRTAAGITRLGVITSRQGRSMQGTWAQSERRVDRATRSMTADTTRMQNRHGASMRSIGTVSGATVGRITGPQYGSWRGGMSRVRSALGTLESAVESRYRAMYRHAADPTRATLQGPFNRGIISAINSLARTFDLKTVARVAIPFRHGGRVRGPGTGTSDSIPALIDGQHPARISTDEFITKARQARRFHRFLSALNEGQPEAEQAAGGAYAAGPGYRDGGMVASTGSAYNAALARGVKVASAMSGKPYIWGGSSAAGADCSGFQSIITNALRGEPNPYRRLWSTASWAGGPIDGFVSGLKSAYAIGVKQGSPGHMAGTLAGTNVESSGRVMFGGGAAGADDGQFTARFSLPVVGGRFVPGGGGSFDPAALVRSAFSGVGRMINGITARWPGNTVAINDAGSARATSRGVQGAMVDKLGSMLAVTGGTGSPAVKNAVRAVAAQYGWGSGAQWSALDWLIGKESSWNPSIKNPSSSATGLFQKMVSIHGPIESTVSGQARWGLNYIRDRYGSPMAAMRWHQGHNWYDRGGEWPSGTWGFNGSGRAERVLEPRTKDNFERLTRVLDSRYGSTLLRSAAAGGDGAAAPLIGSVTMNGPSQPSWAPLLKELRHQTLVASKQVKR